MTNELSVWTPFNTSNQIHTFDECINYIKTLDDSDLNKWVKWKTYANQVVIGTEQYYYKIYQVDVCAGFFIAELREALAKIYREDFGIIWNIKTVIRGNNIYQIEQREKLRVCTSNDMSFTELFIKWSKTLEKLEKLLLLDKIAKQIDIPKLDKLKLIRDCLNKFEDYAITSKGDIVLLDDADWFIAAVDKDSNWITSECKVYDIITANGERVFAPNNLYDRDESHINEPINKWNIFKIDLAIASEIDKGLRTIREQMLYDNIKVLSTGQALPNNQQLYLQDIPKPIYIPNDKQEYIEKPLDK